jgi:hypothetical protein
MAPARATAKGRKLDFRTEFQGIPVSVETRRGALRHWHDPLTGRDGATKMPHHYGYILLTEGADGDHVDCFVGPVEDAASAYVVRQNDPKTGEYDEDKVMLGFASVADAKAAYLASRDDGSRAFGSIVPMPMERFKQRVLEARGGPVRKYDEAEHPRDEQGQWTESGGASSDDFTDAKSDIDDADGPARIQAALSHYGARPLKIRGEAVPNLYVTSDLVVEWNGADRFASVYEKAEWVDRTDPEDFYPDYQDQFNDDFWASGGEVYHATDEENAAGIESDGIEASSRTRGLSNRGVGAAVFTTSDVEETELGSYGPAVFKIDVAAMARDGVKPYASQEPDVVAYELKGALAAAVELDDYSPEEPESGMSVHTVILGGSVPAKYVSRLESGKAYHAKRARFNPNRIVEKYDESEHPRDESGRWTEGGGGGGTAVTDDPEASAERWAKELGATWNGVQEGADGKPKYAMMTEGRTHSTAAVPLEGITRDKVATKLRQVRERFGLTEERDVIERPAEEGEEGDVVLRVGRTHVYIGDYPVPGSGPAAEDPTRPGKAANVSIARHSPTPDWMGYDKEPDPVETRRALVGSVKWLREHGYTYLTAVAVNPGVHSLLERLGATKEPGTGRQWLPLSAIRKAVWDEVEKDVFGTSGTAGILAPEQGVFRKPRRSRPANKAEGIGIPLTVAKSQRVDAGFVTADGTVLRMDPDMEHEDFLKSLPAAQRPAGTRPGRDMILEAHRAGWVRWSQFRYASTRPTLMLSFAAGNPAGAENARKLIAQRPAMGKYVVDAEDVHSGGGPVSSRVFESSADAMVHVVAIGGAGGGGAFDESEHPRDEEGKWVDKDRDGDSFSVGPGVVGGHRFVVGRLEGGRIVEDKEHPRVNPYEAIFQRRGARVGGSVEKYSADQPRDEQGQWSGSSSATRNDPNGWLKPATGDLLQNEGRMHVEHAHDLGFSGGPEMLDEGYVRVTAERDASGSRRPIFGLHFRDGNAAAIAGARSFVERYAGGRWYRFDVERKGGESKSYAAATQQEALDYLDGKVGKAKVEKAYDESLHPRDESGRWSEGGGAAVEHIRAGVASAVEAVPGRAAHGRTAENAFVLTRDGKVYAWNRQGEIADRREVTTVHSHSADSGHDPATLEDFQPLNSRDIKSFLQDTGARTDAIIMADGRLELLHKRNDPALYVKLGKRTKWLDATLHPTYQERQAYYEQHKDEPGYSMYNQERERLSAFAAAHGLDYHDDLRWRGVEKAYEESEHPRDESGRWTDAGGSASGATDVEWRGWTERPEGDYANPEQDRYVENVAHLSGWNGQVVTRAGNGPKFTVGGKEFIEGGHYDPRTDQVVIYIDKEPREGAEQIAVHEASHGLWHAAKPELDKQLDAVRDIATAAAGGVPPPPGLTPKETKNWPYLSPADDRIHPLLKEKYPLAYAYRELMESEWVATGKRVSPYAAAWWAAHEAGDAASMPAVNETLAEISAQTRRWGLDTFDSPMFKEWKAFHHEVMKAGRAHVAPPVTTAASKAAERVVVIGPDGRGEVHEADGTVRWLRPAPVEKDYDEAEHPRDEQGQWTDAGGGAASAGAGGALGERGGTFESRSAYEALQRSTHAAWARRGAALDAAAKAKNRFEAAGHIATAGLAARDELNEVIAQYGIQAGQATLLPNRAAVQATMLLNEHDALSSAARTVDDKSVRNWRASLREYYREPYLDFGNSRTDGKGYERVASGSGYYSTGAVEWAGGGANPESPSWTDEELADIAQDLKGLPPIDDVRPLVLLTTFMSLDQAGSRGGSEMPEYTGIITIQASSRAEDARQTVLHEFGHEAVYSAIRGYGRRSDAGKWDDPNYTPGDAVRAFEKDHAALAASPDRAQRFRMDTGGGRSWGGPEELFAEDFATAFSGRPTNRFGKESVGNVEALTPEEREKFKAWIVAATASSPRPTRE